MSSDILTTLNLTVVHIGKGIKGNQSISKANKTKLMSFCQQMIDLKEDMLHNDGNALIKWIDLFNEFLNLIQNLSEIKLREYMV